MGYIQKFYSTSFSHSQDYKKLWWQQNKWKRNDFNWFIFFENYCIYTCCYVINEYNSYPKW